jgi:ubiquinone/menaquinone biosynthesis C-methylase UbiE
MSKPTTGKKASSIWDKMAAGYDDRTLRQYERAYNLSIQKTRAVLSPGQRVLEIGCGTGIISLGIASSVKRVIATDVSLHMIDVARAKAESLSVTNVDFVVSDGHGLPWTDRSFDVVLLFNILHWVKEPTMLLQEAHRLLKPSGYLASATDCYAEPAPLPIRLMLGLQKLLHLIGVIPFGWYFKQEHIHRLFEQGRFAVVDTGVLHQTPVNYYLLAKKS